MADANKRAKLLMITPNPLYLSWLEEWIAKAKELNETRRIRELNLAIESLKKFPVRLNRAIECIILENFSRQLVDEIQLREEQESRGSESTQNVANWRHASPRHSPNSKSKPRKRGASPSERQSTSEPGTSSPSKIHPFVQTKKPKQRTPIKSSPIALSSSPSPPKRKKSSPSASKLDMLDRRRSPARSPPYLSNLPDATWDNASHQKQLSLVQDLVAPSKKKTRKKETQEVDEMDTQEVVSLDETIIFPPDSFEVFLLIDTAEKGFLTSVSESSLNFRYEVRHLKVGDYAWVARGPHQKELLLPFLVERKRLDDLSKSVKDGRFSEQKFRLKMSNIPNIVYLIENHSVRGDTQSLVQGISNMLIKDSFTVKETRDNLDSVRYLANMTKFLSLTMVGKTLVSSKEYDSDGLQPDIVRLPEFGYFFAGMGKLRTFTSKEMFTKQLVQLHGLSADKAWAIVSKYPTPKALIEAFKASGSSLLSDLTCGLLNRKLGQNTSSVLFKFYTSTDL